MRSAPDPPCDLLLSTEAFARALAVAPETVRRWCRRGTVVPWGRTPSGQLRFHPDQVRQVLQGGTERARDIEAHVAAARARLRVLRRAR